MDKTIFESFGPEDTFRFGKELGEKAKGEVFLP